MAQPFGNLLPERLADELALAQQFGVHPVQVSTSAFDAIIDTGEEIKWAIDTNNNLRIIPKIVNGREISHAAIFKGADVFAAGEAQIAGNRNMGYFGLYVNNNSGHYQPTCASLHTVGIGAFEQQGVKFHQVTCAEGS